MGSVSSSPGLALPAQSVGSRPSVVMLVRSAHLGSTRFSSPARILALTILSPTCSREAHARRQLVRTRPAARVA